MDLIPITININEFIVFLTSIFGLGILNGILAGYSGEVKYLDGLSDLEVYMTMQCTEKVFVLFTWLITAGYANFTYNYEVEAFLEGFMIAYVAAGVVKKYGLEEIVHMMTLRFAETGWPFFMVRWNKEC